MPNGRLSKRAATAALFRAHPDVWLDDEDLARVGGRDASRTRISDNRLLDGMAIVNRLLRYDWGIRSQYKWLGPGWRYDRVLRCCVPVTPQPQGLPWGGEG